MHTESIAVVDANVLKSTEWVDLMIGMSMQAISLQVINRVFDFHWHELPFHRRCQIHGPKKSFAFSRKGFMSTNSYESKKFQCSLSPLTTLFAKSSKRGRGPCTSQHATFELISKCINDATWQRHLWESIKPIMGLQCCIVNAIHLHTH